MGLKNCGKICIINVVAIIKSYLLKIKLDRIIENYP